VRTLGTNAALVVLPRPGDPLGMKDNGYPVEYSSEGCALKSEEVDLKLHEFGLTGLERVFFNAAEDEPDVLRQVHQKRTPRTRQRLAIRHPPQNMVYDIIRPASTTTIQTEIEMSPAARAIGGGVRSSSHSVIVRSATLW
jgi:hypothetical protein